VSRLFRPMAWSAFHNQSVLAFSSPVFSSLAFSAPPKFTPENFPGHVPRQFLQALARRHSHGLFVRLPDIGMSEGLNFCRWLSFITGPRLLHGCGDAAHKTYTRDSVISRTFYSDILPSPNFYRGERKREIWHPLSTTNTSLWAARNGNRKSHTGFRLVPTSVTLNGLERRNSPSFALFHRNR